MPEQVLQELAQSATAGEPKVSRLVEAVVIEIACPLQVLLMGIASRGS